MRPLVPVLVSFLLGIIAGERLGPPFGAVYLLGGLAFLAALVFYLLGWSFSYLIAAPPFFFLGALFIMAHSSPELPPNHIRNILRAAALEENPTSASQKPVLLDIEAEVKSLHVFTGPPPPAVDMEKTRLVVKAKRALVNGRWMSTSGDVLITVKGRAVPLAPGDRVRVMARLREPANFGNPGEFDYKRSLNLKGIYVTGFVKDKRFLALVKGAGTGLNTRLNRRVHKMREAVGSFIESSGALNKEALKALSIGERSGLDPALRKAFTDSGTAHVLAISGLHMGMAALLSYAVILFFLKRSALLLLAFNVKKIAAVVSLVPVVGYGLLAGLPVSAERSAVMVFAYVFTVVINRGRDLYNVLALAALAILVVKPHSIWEVSFQLSFAAVFSIIYLTPRLHGVLGSVGRAGEHSVPGGRGGWAGGLVRRWFKGWLLPAFLVTLAATLGTYPILAYHFNRVSVVGLAANLVVVPLTGVAVPLLLGASWALSVSETLARALLFPADLVLSLMAAAAGFFSSLPHASVSVSTPTIVEIILFYLLILAVSNLKRGRLYRRLALALLLLLVLDSGYWVYGKRFGDTLKVTFISVGQGDSTLIEFPGGTVMLIDGGGFYGGFDPGERIVAPLLRGKKIRRIDYMVLSHAQHDHMGGLGFIARNFNVKEFWWNGVGDLRGLVGALEGSGALIREIGSGTRIPPIGGVRIEVLHPYPGLGLGLNDMSLVLKLSYGSKSFLFTGDIGEEAEAGLARRVFGLGATVLKSPHHGSRTSSSGALLGTATASVAVISVGRANVFGFPHRATLERYREAGMEVYRTDLDGAVEVSTDGARLWVVPYVGRRGSTEYLTRHGP